ncbi:PD-(D/E)XK nuclease family protein [Streptomyces sp. NPDC017086]|uniref:PD-(D/E)XK nuclease family protein n=1 Tax=Streptomyces sp. NPDC017086 TaxID=3364976 RepID=UPI0037B7A220
MGEAGADWPAVAEEVERLTAAGLWNPPPGTAMEILGLGRREVPHSRMVGWLLDPAGSHGLGPRLLDAFLRRAGRERPAGAPRAGEVRVEREVVLRGGDGPGDRRADLVVRLDGTPVVVEMKIDAQEGAGQTTDLAGHFRASHGIPLFVYLTLDGSPAVDPAFVPMSLRDVAHDLRAALATAPVPAGAAAAVGRRTAADYLETLGMLTRTNAAARAAARFWLRHGDARAYDEARAAAWTVLRELPDRTAHVLGQHPATAGDDGLRVVLRTERVQGSGGLLREDRVVLLTRERWTDGRGEPRAGVGFAVREHRHRDDSHWSQENMPYYGIWLADPAPARQPLLGRPRPPWGNWGADWDYFPLSLDGTEPDDDPADTYAARAAALLHTLWTAHEPALAALLDAQPPGDAQAAVRPA